MLPIHYMVVAEAPETTVSFQIERQRKREDKGTNRVSPAAKLPSNTFPRNHTFLFMFHWPSSSERGGVVVVVV